MMESSKLIGFRIEKIVTDQFTINEDTYRASTPLEIQNALNFAIDKTHGRITVKHLAQFQYPDLSPFITIAIRCIFHVEPNDWIGFQEEGSTIKIPKEFAIHLAMLVVGILRGALHTKTESTNFNKFILPPFNVKDLVPNDIAFD